MAFLSKFGKIKRIQCDGGSEFKKEWRIYAKESGCEIRISKPYKKNEQAYIESFNGSLRRECVGWKKYKREEKERGPRGQRCRDGSCCEAGVGEGELL